MNVAFHVNSSLKIQLKVLRYGVCTVYCTGKEGAAVGEGQSIENGQGKTQLFHGGLMMHKILSTNVSRVCASRNKKE